MNMDINWGIIIPFMSIVPIILTAIFWFFGSIITDYMNLPDQDYRRAVRIGFEFSIKHLMFPLVLGIVILNEYPIKISITGSIFLILLVVVPSMRLLLWSNSRWWDILLIAISVLFWYLFINSVELVWNFLSTKENFVFGVVLGVVFILMMLYVLKETAKIYGIKHQIVNIFVDIELDDGTTISGILLSYLSEFVIVFSNDQRVMINKDKIVLIKEHKINPQPISYNRY